MVVLFSVCPNDYAHMCFPVSWEYIPRSDFFWAMCSFCVQYYEEQLQYLLNWLQQFTFPPAIYKVSNYSVSYQLFLKTIGPLCLHLPHHQNLPTEDWNCFLDYLSCVFTFFFLKFPACQKITIYIKHLSSARDWSNLEVTESLQQHKHLILYKNQWSPDLFWEYRECPGTSSSQTQGDNCVLMAAILVNGKWLILIIDLYLLVNNYVKYLLVCYWLLQMTYILNQRNTYSDLPAYKTVCYFYLAIVYFIDGEYTPMSDTWVANIFSYIGVGRALTYPPSLLSFSLSPWDEPSLFSSG